MKRHSEIGLETYAIPFEKLKYNSITTVTELITQNYVVQELLTSDFKPVELLKSS